jgi:xylan 1,4-beta-xylosidase
MGFCWIPTIANTFTVTADATASWGALPHFWTCFGTGHYGMFFTHPEIKDHLKDAATNLGMDKIRSHGFLHDDMEIYHETGGKVVYNWAKADSVIFFLKSIGIRPIMEFGCMPADLASSQKTTLAWKENISPPKDYDKWRNLIYEFVKHYKDTLGAAEIEKWRFEVWNEPEPELNAFFAGTWDEYLKIYDKAVDGAKSAHPGIKIGGPSPSGPWVFSRITNLLTHCKEGKIPIDCVLYHTWNIADARDGHFQALDIINKFDPNLESIDTEWGPTYNFHMANQPQETTQGAVCAADVLCSISRRCHLENKKFPFAFSWWVITDVFEEAGWNGYRNTPINTGNMGLISREGLHKPAYNVFKMLNMMGNTQISISATPNGTVNGMASINTDSSVQVMLYNSVKDYGPAEGPEQPPAGSDDVTFTIKGVPLSKVNYRRMLVDGEHGNAYGEWLKIGKPGLDQMDSTKWKTLRTASVLDTVDSANGMQIDNKTFSKSFSLRKEGVTLITLSPLSVTAVPREIVSNSPTVDSRISASYFDGKVQMRTAGDPAYGFELIALNGRVLLTRQGLRGNCTIKTGAMGPGVYVIKLNTETGKSVLRQVVVPAR